MLDLYGAAALQLSGNSVYIVLLILSLICSSVWVIPTSCVGINLVCRDHPAGLAPLGMVPPHSVDPSTLGRNIPIPTRFTQVLPHCRQRGPTMDAVWGYNISAQLVYAVFGLVMLFARKEPARLPLHCTSLTGSNAPFSPRVEDTPHHSHTIWEELFLRKGHGHGQGIRRTQASFSDEETQLNNIQVAECNLTKNESKVHFTSDSK